MADKVQKLIRYIELNLAFSDNGKTSEGDRKMGFDKINN